MSLIGFDERFENLRDYILSITSEIWEGRGINLIHDYYADSTIVRTPDGVTYGLDSVINGTVETLAAFPDRTLLGEDVIAKEINVGVYYSSHRIRSQMTHLGHNQLAKGSGKTVFVRTIADCICHENRIIEEWLVRDNANTVLQLGLSPKKVGKQKAKHLLRKDLSYSQENQLASWKGSGELSLSSDLLHKIHTIYVSLWQRQSLGLIAESYDRAYIGYLPAGEIAQSHAALEFWLLSYLSAFPKGEFNIHHMIEEKSNDLPIRISMRWTYVTEHTGYGRFGKPTNAPIVISALTQIEIRHGKIYQEWHLIDEVNIWCQIYAYQESLS